MPEHCAVCETPRDEWARDRIILGELTRSDVNAFRADADRAPVCSQSCHRALDADQRVLEEVPA